MVSSTSRRRISDGDHIIDYVYAGDILGNVWRFDLTSQNPNNWAVMQVGGYPRRSTPHREALHRSPPSVVVAIGCLDQLESSGHGRVRHRAATAFTNSLAATYSTTQQYLIGIWDWNMGAWNATTSPVKYDALTSSTTPVAPTTALSGLGELEQQTITGTYDPTDAASSASSSVQQPPTIGPYRAISSAGPTRAAARALRGNMGGI